MDRKTEAEYLLRQYYGYAGFRSGQWDLISHVLEGSDVLGIMPTGAGKSVCYQIPALMLSGVTLVITPLISLMKDQVDALQQMGIAARCLNSTQDETDYRDTMRDLWQGECSLLYVAPERLESDGFRSMLEGMNIAMVAVDEAHCVSQWGHDFRPSYRKIADVIRMITEVRGGRPRVCAFTATATEAVRDDIIELLELRKPYMLTTGFDRPNLHFSVQKPRSKTEYAIRFVKEHGDEAGIIYCSTRKKVESLAASLMAAGIRAVHYHAGLEPEERRIAQELFQYDRADVMVATNAFGMGIDKSNVRYVLHYNMPKSMEAYYQEAGRAGRDGEPAQCVLLFASSDVAMATRLIEMNDTDEENRRAEYGRLQGMIRYCHTDECLRRCILSYFGEEYPAESCDNCSNCSAAMERTDITVECQKILSCVRRMGEQWGAALVTSVLRGSDSAQIRQMGFDKLSTFGIMAEVPASTIREMISYFVAKGYLSMDGRFGALALTPASLPILRGEQKVSLYRRVQVQPKKPAKSMLDNENPNLFSRLRELRARLAKEQGVPPFVIFSDSTLLDMCRRLPYDEDTFVQVSGVGASKLKRYGKAFLEVIGAYRRENMPAGPTPAPKADKPVMRVTVLPPEPPKKKKKAAPRKADKPAAPEAVYIPPPAPPVRAVPEETPASNRRSDTHLVSYDLDREGYSVEDIARMRGLTVPTVEGHLMECVGQGMEVNHVFATRKEAALIRWAARKLGKCTMKDIYEELHGAVGYAAIRYVTEIQMKKE